MFRYLESMSYRMTPQPTEDHNPISPSIRPFVPFVFPAATCYNAGDGRIADMRRLSGVLLLCVLLAVPTAADVVRTSESPFGVICSWPGIKDAGIKWVRAGAGCSALDWGAVEKERGVFDWTNADAEVNGWIRDEGVDLLVILGYTPKWASSGPNGENSAPPRSLKDWTDFVHAVVSRYKGKVKYWEVWNEPDIGFWTGTIEQYSDLLKSAYVAAKKADPECKVVFGGTAGVNLPFIERVYDTGGQYFFDVMAVHPYQWGETFDDAWFTLQLRNLRDLMDKRRDLHKEIWLTELGWSTGDKGITEEVQARLLQQAMITSLTCGDMDVAKAFWFSVKDWVGPGHGLIRPDGTRKPAFEAYRLVTGMLSDYQYLGALKHETLRCHRFQSADNKVLLAAWHPGKGTATLDLPKEKHWTEIRRLGGTEPVKALSIEVGPEPVFVLSSDGSFSSGPFSRMEPGDRYYRRDVWLSVSVPEETSRPYVIRGGRRLLPIKVHNDSDGPVEVRLEPYIGSLGGSRKPFSVKAGEVADVELKFQVPANAKLGMTELRIQGSADKRPLAPIEMPVRMAEGRVIEFLANSVTEGRYLVENEGSGAAPSVRFNGMWTYKFDLSKAVGATMELNVGAHQAKEWQVLVSRDRVTWEMVLSGKSDRSWHKVDLGAWVGGRLFVKFTGDDQQLSELVLVTSSPP